MHALATSNLGKAALAVSTALIALTTVGTSSALAAHNPRPAGPPAAPAVAPSSAVVASPTGAQAQGGPRPEGIPLRPLVGDGTITVDQARAVREQLRTDARSAREQARTTALNTLIGEGALTQAQADAIVAAGRGGLRTLVASGTLTAEQAREVQAEFAEYGSSDTSGASLAALVLAGVLTQAQADAIADILPAPGARS